MSGTRWRHAVQATQEDLLVVTAATPSTWSICRLAQSADVAGVAQSEVSCRKTLLAYYSTTPAIESGEHTGVTSSLSYECRQQSFAWLHTQEALDDSISNSPSTELI